jgi:hypothetical protein
MTKKKDPKDLKTKEQKNSGRPSLYSEELGDLICKKIATNAMSLRNICQKYPELPSHDTINEWRWEYPEFSDRYLVAKRTQAELMFDDCLEIADDGTNDWMDSLPKDEQPLGYKLNGEHVQRSKLRIDTRMRLNARLSQNNNKPPDHGQSEIEKLLNEGS